jgi:hypothetical protein
MRFTRFALPHSVALAATALCLCAVAHPAQAATCAAPWAAGAVYTGGSAASVGTSNYIANWWTQGQNPSANSGGSGSGQPWTFTGACGGTAPTPTPTPTPTPPSTSTTHLFAPYVDMSISADENLVAMQQQAGFKAVTLAFLDATNGCSVGWGGLGGTLPTDTLPNGDTILHIVQQLQTAGVQVVISFGGATGTEPALNCSSASQLQALYQSVINRYSVKLLDFDIEGGATTNQASITLRDGALKGLKAANPGLVISYTLPVLPTGLIASGVNILNSAHADGAVLDVVNVMAMDYGSSQDNGAQMGLDATNAASATEAQIRNAGLSATVGITPMIGVNDTNTEIFNLNDAQTVLNFANGNSYVSRIAIWSLGRDNGGCAGQTWASPSCSGISQSAFGFSANFRNY